MKFTRAEVLEVLIDALCEAQEDIVDAPEEINENTRPIGELLEFDSLTSVAVTVHCLTVLGFRELEFPTLFIDKRRALTVGEVADRIMGLKRKL